MTPERLQAIAQILKTSGHGAMGDEIAELAGTITTLVEASQTASNYIHHVGANYTVKGKPHPQELLLTNLDNAIDSLAPFKIF